MAVVDFDLRFTYVLAGWEGSAHDALILADALEKDDGLSVASGKYYLVDAGYAARPGFLPPFRGCRYHLKEYDRRNYPRDSRELFKRMAWCLPISTMVPRALREHRAIEVLPADNCNGKPNRCWSEIDNLGTLSSYKC